MFTFSFFVAVAFLAHTSTAHGPSCEDVKDRLPLCQPCCHCIPDDPTDTGSCPDIGDCLPALAYDAETVAKFTSYKLVESLPEFEIPKFNPSGCQP
jgi:hypothetical protein